MASERARTDRSRAAWGSQGFACCAQGACAWRPLDCLQGRTKGCKASCGQASGMEKVRTCIRRQTRRASGPSTAHIGSSGGGDRFHSLCFCTCCNKGVIEGATGNQTGERHDHVNCSLRINSNLDLDMSRLLQHRVILIFDLFECHFERYFG